MDNEAFMSFLGAGSNSCWASELLEVCHSRGFCWSVVVFIVSLSWLFGWVCTAEEPTLRTVDTQMSGPKSEKHGFRALVALAAFVLRLLLPNTAPAFTKPRLAFAYQRKLLSGLRRGLGGFF